MSKPPDTLIPVADAPGHTAAHAMAAALRDAGIEAFVFDTARTTLQLHAPGVIAPFQVHVRRADADLAGEVLRDNRDESVDIDWSEVDVGEPEDETAARLASRHTAAWLGEGPARRPYRGAVLWIAGTLIAVWVVVSLL